MQPRGQLWFELQRVCQDFRDFSGLEPTDAGQILVIVLRNLLAEQEDALAKLAPSTGEAG
jgi:DNA-binding transcriptional LysR family regulator